MRRAAALGVALLALALGLLLWRVNSPVRARASGVGEHAATASEDVPAAPSPGGAGAPVRIEETVGDGPVPFSGKDGLLRFRVDDGPAADAPVRDGQWEAAAPRGSTLTIEEIRFGDRSAVAVRPAVEVPEDGRVDVECRWLAPTLLRVIGEKGEDLREVEYYETDEYDDWGPGWPEATAAAPPIELAGAEGVHTYLVRAPGHAWSRIPVFVGFGGERVVRLARAGTLVVRLEPYDPESGVTVRVDTDCWWEPDETGRVTIDSLRPGDHEIIAQVRSGISFEVVGEAVAMVDPGKTTELTLPIGAVPTEPDLVSLAGTIEVAPGWTEEDEATPSCMTPFLTAWNPVQGSVDPEPPGEDGRWYAGDVRPEHYNFGIDKWSWVEAVDVGPQGARDVRLSVPPPCDVEVRLVDAGTGELIREEDDIWWYARAPDVDADLPGYLAIRRQEYPAEPGIYRFRAPLGVLVAGHWNRMRSAEDVEIELKPGLNRVQLKAAWTLAADIVLMDGAMPVPVDDGFRESLEAVATDALGSLDFCENGDPLRVHVTRPGRYRVSFPEIEGYEPIAPVEVEVAPGRIPRVEIALRRRGR